MTADKIPCPACGALGSGAYCASCGAARGQRWCTTCGREVPAGDRFCGACGGPVAAGLVGRPSQPTPTVRPNWLYFIAGIVVLGAVIVAVWSRTDRAPALAPPAAPATGAAAIDLSTMTPRERFDRLYDRVMRASEGGDDATVTQFAPMALMAYTQLDSIDIDARYHAAMIRMHTGDVPGAAALADTIRAQSPTHLFSFVIHGTLARQRGDQPALQRERAGFLTNYQAEMARELPEYSQHTVILDQFVAEARAVKP